MANRTEQIHAHDGGEFSAYLALPESGSGPGLVVIQEIFGVNAYIKGVCERLAKLGYLAMAPDIYWRLGPGIAIDEKEPGAVQKAFGYVGGLDFTKATDDAIAALEHLRGVPEVAGGKAGILGFCMGGNISYMVAGLSDPVTCVSYYGASSPEFAGQVRCPILFHYGGADERIPADKQQAVMEAFAKHRDAEFHVHEGAAHAFDNPASSMLNPERAPIRERAAREAWAETAEFLRRTLPI